jgi:hypothetical protein
MKKCLDSGSGMRKWSDPDPGSGIKHPGSASLFLTFNDPQLGFILEPFT